MLEKVELQIQFMRVRLQSLLENNNILYEHQYGFRMTYSTNLALIEGVDEIHSNLSNDLYGIGIFLDLQKPFDTLNHNILLHKLRHYSIRRNA